MSIAMELLESKFAEKHNAYMENMLQTGRSVNTSSEAIAINTVRVAGALAMLKELMDELEELEKE